MGRLQCTAPILAMVAMIFGIIRIYKKRLTQPTIE